MVGAGVSALGLDVGDVAVLINVSLWSIYGGESRTSVMTFLMNSVRPGST